jgi:hypothetical protein
MATPEADEKPRPAAEPDPDPKDKEDKPPASPPPGKKGEAPDNLRNREKWFRKRAD